MLLETIGQKIAVSLATNWLKKFTQEKLPSKQMRGLWLASKLADRKTLYRVSVGYLYRIKLDDQYLLARGKRIDQFQPVGGARKWYAPALDALETMGVRDDDCLPIDDTSRHDLRLRVPAKRIFDFLNWYNKQKYREVDQTREFQEELIKPGFLPAAPFATINVRYLYTAPTFHYSPYFQCQELLYHEVYELMPTAEQEVALRTTQLGDHTDYKWVTENLIERLGYDAKAKTKPFAIGEHTKLLLSNTTHIFAD